MVVLSLSLFFLVYLFQVYQKSLIFLRVILKQEKNIKISEFSKREKKKKSFEMKLKMKMKLKREKTWRGVRWSEFIQ